MVVQKQQWMEREMVNDSTETTWWKLREMVLTVEKQHSGG